MVSIRTLLLEYVDSQGASHISELHKDSLKDISQKSLLDFLKKTKQISNLRPQIEFAITRKDKTTRTLSVKITNNEEQAFWLNPSLVAVSFEADRVRYYREIDWAEYRLCLYSRMN